MPLSALYTDSVDVGNPECKLDHILVLHVEGGSDFFISIMGNYTLSCFGISLNHLALQLPRNQNKLHRGKITKATVLPSMQYRESQPYASGWELPAKEDMSSLDLDDHLVASPHDPQRNELQHSSSIATTGQEWISLEHSFQLEWISVFRSSAKFTGGPHRFNDPIPDFKNVILSGNGWSFADGQSVCRQHETDLQGWR